MLNRSFLYERRGITADGAVAPSFRDDWRVALPPPMDQRGWRPPRRPQLALIPSCGSGVDGWRSTRLGGRGGPAPPLTTAPAQAWRRPPSRWSGARGGGSTIGRRPPRPGRCLPGLAGLPPPLCGCTLRTRAGWGGGARRAARRLAWGGCPGTRVNGARAKAVVARLHPWGVSTLAVSVADVETDVGEKEWEKKKNSAHPLSRRTRHCPASASH